MNSLIAQNKDNKQQYYDLAGSCSTTAFLYYCNRNMSFISVFNCLLKSRKIAFASYLLEKFRFTPQESNYKNVIATGNKIFITKFLDLYFDLYCEKKYEKTNLLVHIIQLDDDKLYSFFLQVYRNYFYDGSHLSVEPNPVFIAAIEKSNNKILTKLCSEFEPRSLDVDALFHKASQMRNKEIINILINYFDDYFKQMCDFAYCGLLSHLQEVYEEQIESIGENELWHSAITGKQLEICDFLHEVECEFDEEYFHICAEESNGEIYEWLQAHYPYADVLSLVEMALESYNYDIMTYFFAHDLVPEKEFFFRYFIQNDPLEIVFTKYFSYYHQNEIFLCARCGNFATLLSEDEVEIIIYLLVSNPAYILSLFRKQTRINCDNCHSQRGYNIHSEDNLHELKKLLGHYIKKNNISQRSILMSTYDCCVARLKEYEDIWLNSAKTIYWGDYHYDLLKRKEKTKYYINNEENEKLYIGSFSPQQIFEYYSKRNRTVSAEYINTLKRLKNSSVSKQPKRILPRRRNQKRSIKNDKMILVDYDEYSQGDYYDYLLEDHIRNNDFFYDSRKKKFVIVNYEQYYESPEPDSNFLPFHLKEDYFFYDTSKKQFVLTNYEGYFYFYYYDKMLILNKEDREEMEAITNYNHLVTVNMLNNWSY